LGNNFFLFRSVFFKPQKRPWAVEWKFNKDLTDNLHDTLKNRSIRYQRSECVTLPELLRTPIAVEFPAETLVFFQSATEDLNNNLKAGNVDKVKASFIKMREIASGFVNFKGEDGETRQIIFDQNPKLDALVAKLQQLPETEKAIVFHDFTFSGEQIDKALAKAKIGHRWVYGGTPDKKKLEYIKAFKFDPKIQVLILNSASGAFGLNMQHANYMFFFECPVDPLVRDQAEGRIYRTGQLKTTNMYDIVVKGSIEERILEFIREGKNLLQELIEHRGKHGETLYVE
jgi:SNF2 family DNA or RNA helicase